MRGSSQISVPMLWEVGMYPGAACRTRYAGIHRWPTKNHIRIPLQIASGRFEACLGARKNGVDEQIDTIEAAANTWELLTISGMYTGTGTVIIEVGFECYGGTTRTITLEKPCSFVN